MEKEKLFAPETFSSDTKATATAATLFCKNLTASYGQKTILKNISLEIHQGQLICLCGLNGSGKSTLLSLLAGLQQPNLKADSDVAPSLVLRGQTTTGTPASSPAALNSAGTSAPLAISSLTRTQAARYISYMQQTEYSIWDFTVEDFILQGRFPYTKHGIYSKHDKALVETVIDELCLNKLKGRNVHSLSGGEMQKVKIARALAQEPLFILLDEPSANLDVVFEPRLLQLLKDLAKKKNIGILMSIHDINIISDVADYVWLLPPAGSIAPTTGSSPTPGLITGTYQEVMTLENLKTTFGEDFQWIEKKYFQLLQ